MMWACVPQTGRLPGAESLQADSLAKFRSAATLLLAALSATTTSVT
jgi:hypothetical protein